MVEFDPSKRAATLTDRGLDMADAGVVFEGPHITFEDDRFPYGETRFVTVGFLSGRMVFIAWTQKETARRIISMRKANEREQKAYAPRLGR